MKQLTDKDKVNLEIVVKKMQDALKKLKDRLPEAFEEKLKNQEIAKPRHPSADAW